MVSLLRVAHSSIVLCKVERQASNASERPVVIGPAGQIERTFVNPKVRHLLAQITSLEDELRAALREQETHLFYQIKGKRVEFEDTIRETHRKRFLAHGDGADYHGKLEAFRVALESETAK
jgi:hypothetical protein